MSPMMVPQFELLDWDSRFFGFPVAHLTHFPASPAEISTLLAQLRQEHIRLTYCSCEPENRAVESMVASIGRLVDQKCEYVLRLSQTVLINDQQEAMLTENNSIDQETLLALAPQCSEFSRFRIDPDMPVGSAEKLYRIWMEKSLSGDLADAVLVKRVAGEIAGVVTVKESNNAGKIGLLCVDARHRGLGIGAALVRAAVGWFSDRKCVEVAVVTQGTNRIACRLYECAGFTLRECKHIYHIWSD